MMTMKKKSKHSLKKKWQIIIRQIAYCGCPCYLCNRVMLCESTSVLLYATHLARRPRMSKGRSLCGASTRPKYIVALFLHGTHAATWTFCSYIFFYSSTTISCHVSFVVFMTIPPRVHLPWSLVHVHHVHINSRTSKHIVYIPRNLFVLKEYKCTLNYFIYFLI